jgi:hypothetical protein
MDSSTDNHIISKLNDSKAYKRKEKSTNLEAESDPMTLPSSY